MINLEKLRTLYNFGRNITLSDVQLLISAASRKSFEAGEYLIKEGSTKKDVFFIRKGLVRRFLLNEKGEEITTLIRWEEQVVTSADIVLFNQPSRFYFQTLEPTDVFVIDYDTLQNIIAKHPKLEQNRKFMLQKLLKEAIHHLESFQLLSPEERYLDFIQSNPDIDNRVPNKYIANILGITPVSLSRIRKRIASKKTSAL